MFLLEQPGTSTPLTSIEYVPEAGAWNVQFANCAHFGLQNALTATVLAPSLSALELAKVL